MNYEITVETENEDGPKVTMKLTDAKEISDLPDLSTLADQALTVFVGSFSDDDGELTIDESELTVKIKAIIYEDTWVVGEDIA